MKTSKLLAIAAFGIVALAITSCVKGDNLLPKTLNSQKQGDTEKHINDGAGG